MIHDEWDRPAYGLEYSARGHDVRLDLVDYLVTMIPGID